MTDVRTAGSILSFAFLLATLLLATSCSAKHSDNADADPFASSAQDQTPDPLNEKHQRGWLWAQRNDVKLITDCGGMTDDDERYGCATYVNNLPH